MSARAYDFEGTCAAVAVLAAGLLIVQHDMPPPLSWATAAAAIFCANWCLTRPAPLDRTILVLIAAISFVAVRTMPAAAVQQPACPAAIVGPATVIDGDTLRIDEHRIRLHGIAAPEIDDRFGETAAKVLAGVVEGRELSCTVVDVDRHGRCVATCTAGHYVPPPDYPVPPGGFDVGQEMVVIGLARDLPEGIAAGATPPTSCTAARTPASASGIPSPATARSDDSTDHRSSRRGRSPGR